MQPSIICLKRNNFKRIATILAMTLSILMGGLSGVHAASCMKLADIPMAAMEKEAPGMIMFVIDDSGSMDWSLMCPPDQESSGLFDGMNYIFKNPGDDVYSSSENIEDYDSHRMMWMSQWSGYNGMYYDPTTEYIPWPRRPPADVNNPRSNPMKSGYTLDMTKVWETMAVVGAIVDDSDTDPAQPVYFTKSSGWGKYTSSSSGYKGAYLYSNRVSTSFTHTAQWRASGLDPAKTYHVEARWDTDDRRDNDVIFKIYDNTTHKKTSPAMNQQENDETWMRLASNVTFSSGTGIVKLERTNVNKSDLCADAVRFVETGAGVEIMRRHYYVRNAVGETFLVNLRNNAFEYFRVNLADPDGKREVVTSDMLVRLSDGAASTAGIVTGRSFAEECQNFSNWYSFYRRRELTAKNAIARVVDSINGVYVGMISINKRMTQQPMRPVKVALDGTTYDESQQLLDALYALNSSGGTPLRRGLSYAGKYFQGDYMKPSSFIPQVSSASYPFFRSDKGGACQKAFTILFSDGYYNSDFSGVSNADGDNNTAFDGSPFGDTRSNTLADIAMRYYEKDLKTNLPNEVPTSTEDPATHQHMVTYTIAFGVTGSLDTDLYGTCPIGACPGSWPDNDTSVGKIDDMFHAAVNGRGKYLAAGNTRELNEALEALAKNISDRLGAGAAVATNSVQLKVGTTMYKGTYNTANWFGEVSAHPLSLCGKPGTPTWRASEKMPSWNQRKIFSWNKAPGATNGGVVFSEANLRPEQTALLLAAAPTGAAIGDVVNYLKGDNSKAGGLLRNRSEPLGDIVHSAPIYFKNTVYVGANDGMLHAFDAASGKELFAYIPGLVYGHLGELSHPNYSHKFYVDNTATIAKAGGKDMLVCGLGKGGKGYFALDVTDPANMDASKVLWEFTDVDMGYSYSRAYVIKTSAYGEVVIFGNGYGTSNGVDASEGSGRAYLYVLDAQTGALKAKLDTKVGGVTECNGLSTPAPVDVELDGYVDYVFAGDLKGNMWKFDMRTGGFAYGSAASPMPLIRVQNAAGQAQPITAAPQVMLDANQTKDKDLRGLMVIFGTGQYLNYDDFSDINQQSFYGIWDWGPSWEKKAGNTTADQDKSLGTCSPDRSLPSVGSGIRLLEQKFQFKTGDGKWGVLTDYEPRWYNPFGSGLEVGIHMGWFIDLPQPGERSLLQPILSAGAAIMVSAIPSTSACTSGGSSGIYAVKAASGGRYPSPVFDLNEDGKVDQDDKLSVDGQPIAAGYHVHDAIITGINTVGDDILAQDTQGQNPGFGAPSNPPGMFYWRVLGQ